MKTVCRRLTIWLVAIFTVGLFTFGAGLTAHPVQALPNVDIVFVARAHLATKDDIFQD